MEYRRYFVIISYCRFIFMILSHHLVRDRVKHSKVLKIFLITSLATKFLQYLAGLELCILTVSFVSAILKLRKHQIPPKSWTYSTKWGQYRRREPAYSTKLFLDHKFWRWKTNSHYHLFEMDLQLWFLDTKNSPSTGRPKHFEANSYPRA